MATRAGAQTHKAKSAGFIEVGAIDLTRHGRSVNGRYLTLPSTMEALIPPKPNELLII
jgi:hypothetical protein